MTRRLLISALLLVVLLLGGWYLLSWKPTTSRLGDAQRATAAAVSQRSVLEAKLGTLRATERNIPTVRRALATSAAALPVTASVDSVIDQIDQAATATDVTWTNESQSLSAATSTSTSSSTSSALASGTASTMALTLQVSGRYANVLRFVDLLQHRPRLVVVDNIAFSPNGGNLALAISARAFYDPTALPKIPSATSR